MQLKTIFNKEYNVYDVSCCSNTSLRTLYIDLLNICNASCDFCSASCNIVKQAKYTDLNFIKEEVTELVNKQVIDKITLTGGEPLLYPYLKELLEFLDTVDLNFYAITTNGIKLLDNIDLLNGSNVTYVNISRHHISDEINRTIFHANTPSINDLQKAVSLLNMSTRLNCTLTDNLFSLSDYIAMADIIGVDKVLFRQNYYDNDYKIPNLFTNYTSEKTSTKCKCLVKQFNKLNVEYRYVDANKERDIESQGDYIRNFVIHNDNTLHGGWNKNSIIIEALSCINENKDIIK